MLGRILKGIIQSTESTGDRKMDPWLKTRYYKATKDKIWTEVLSSIETMEGMRMIHQSKSLGEISITSKGLLRSYDITITIVALTPLNIAVDIHSALRGAGGDFGGSYFHIVRIQKKLDQALATLQINGA
jgi:hypothetical protein